MHRRPSQRWTLAALAACTNASRSVLAERFQRLLGEPPLTYLARWRMQLAARRLETSRDTVLKVAADVGYESEAAFNRAFKREFQVPPARYRKRSSSHDEADRLAAPAVVARRRRAAADRAADSRKH